MKRPLPFHSNAVWPPLGMVVVFAVTYGMVAGIVWLIESTTPMPRGGMSDTEEIKNMLRGILAGAAGIYALYRLWRFHPACNSNYAAWLKSSPWTPDKPLPLGPVHLVWQDAAVVGILTALAYWNGHTDPRLPVFVFGLGYLAGMTLLLGLTRTRIAGRLLGFLWPAAILPGMRGPPAYGLAAALIVVIWLGHRQSLRAFPWKRSGSDEPETLRANRGKSVLNKEIRIEGLSDASAAQVSNAGWPFGWLTPKVRFSSITTANSFFLSVEFGWWTYCAIVGFEWASVPGVVVVFAGVAALIRWVVYCAGLGPPFNVWGRLFSGQIIVPGYDRVFVTPLMVVILGVAGEIAIGRSGAWHPTATAVVVAVLWFTVLSGGPTKRNWILTGQLRYRPPAALGANRQLLRPI